MTSMHVHDSGDMALPPILGVCGVDFSLHVVILALIWGFHYEPFSKE